MKEFEKYPFRSIAEYEGYLKDRKEIREKLREFIKKEIKKSVTPRPLLQAHPI